MSHSNSFRFCGGTFLRFVLAFALALPQQAQQKKEETVTFTSTSTLVIVNCFVRDKSGNPVEGLNKEDFKLLEDGKPQNIAVFEFQKLEDPEPAAAPAKPVAIAAVKTPAQPKPPAAIKPSKPGEVRYRDRRLIALLFDFSSMSQPDQIRAQAAAQKFLSTQMSPSDVVSILSFSNSLKVEQDFTDDRDQLARVIKGFKIGEGRGLAGEADTADTDTGEDTQAAFT